MQAINWFEWVNQEQNTENQDKLITQFSDWLRKKFHDANPNCSLAQFTALDKNLKKLSQTVESLFWVDSYKILKLLSELPAQYIENISKYGDEIIKRLANDLKDDINSLDNQEYKTWYMQLIIKDLQDSHAEKKQDKTEVQQTLENNERIKYNNILIKAVKDKEAVQNDPATAQYFKTTDYRLRKENIRQELDARPDLKATLQAQFWEDAPTTDALADLVATKIFIQEKGLKTTSTASFMQSYDKLDDMLHFGTYQAGEFGKNDNVLNNTSYSKVLQEPAPREFAQSTLENPQTKIKALELAKHINPWAFNGEFINKYTNAVQQKDENALKKLQAENPEQFKILNKIETKMTALLTQSARVSTLRAYNWFVGWMFNGLINWNFGSDNVAIKTNDDKLVLSENWLRFDFQIQGKDCKFETKDWKLYMTNLLKQDKQTKAYWIESEEIPLTAGTKIPTVKEILDAVFLDIQSEWMQNLFSGENPLNDFWSIQAKVKPKVDRAIQQHLDPTKQHEITNAVCNQSQKFYCATKLIALYVPPQYDYTVENKLKSTIHEDDRKQGQFYSYLDVLKNTFYSPENPAPASQMLEFTNKVQTLLDSKAIKPDDFFKLFSKPEAEKSGFIRTRPIKDEKYIDLTKFDEYASKLL